MYCKTKTPYPHLQELLGLLCEKVVMCIISVPIANTDGSHPQLCLTCASLDHSINFETHSQKHLFLDIPPLLRFTTNSPHNGSPSTGE